MKVYTDDQGNTYTILQLLNKVLRDTKDLRTLTIQEGEHFDESGTPSVELVHRDGKAVLVFNYMKGSKGDTGETGPRGPKGENGTSVSIQPSEEDCTELGQGYLDSNGDLQVLVKLHPRTFENAGHIQGPQGEQGEKGDTGATGPIGPQGPQGPQGIQGIPGQTTLYKHTLTFVHDSATIAESITYVDNSPNPITDLLVILWSFLMADKLGLILKTSLGNLKILEVSNYNNTLTLYVMNAGSITTRTITYDSFTDTVTPY